MADLANAILDSILDQQREAWLAGSRPDVVELLEGTSLEESSEAQLDLIYNEIVLREELGEHPSEVEYARRFPHMRTDLELQFEVHRAVQGDKVLAQTAQINVETLPEVKLPAGGLGPNLPEYEVLHRLGQGGMGVVYKARHRRLHRNVALKMFRPGRIPTAREISRFQTEAEAIARLQHPNIVQIFEVGQADGLPYLALELADRGTLSEQLKKYPFAPRAAAELIQTLAGAVHHAHDRNIIHRDLKPSNVLFTHEGTPKLTDFGLAKLLEEDPDSPRDATRTGEPIGTPRYMSPEQATGRHDGIGPATDVYALGTLLYECLTGQVPFVATSVVETLQRIHTEEPLSPRRLQPAIPRDLETICLHCLHKEPTRRYASAQALANDLGHFLCGEPIAARPTPTWERVWKWCRRRPTHAALIAVALLLAIGGATAASIWSHREKQRLAGLRVEVAGLVQRGQDALLLKDEEAAQARFREAWHKVQGEPELQDFQTGVSGWLDHSLKAANLQHWKLRTPPREYDERRDDALLQSLLLDSTKREPVASARQAIREAIEFTLPNDPAWRVERERLAMVDADLILMESDAGRALARLEEMGTGASRGFALKKASFLDRLGSKSESEAERLKAVHLPPDETGERFLDGIDRLRRRDFAGAEREFEAVLGLEPEHYTARLFLALCAFHQNRAAEARVGLTACIAQRPRYAWNYQFRGQCSEKLGNAADAKRDFAQAAELQPEKTDR